MIDCLHIYCKTIQAGCLLPVCLVQCTVGKYTGGQCCSALYTGTRINTCAGPGLVHPPSLCRTLVTAISICQECEQIQFILGEENKVISN